MQIAHIHPNSEIYGPGKRFVIWTQGCSIRCPGCWNTEFWSFDTGPGLSLDELLSQINEVKNEVEGITILGGEPFDQAIELLQLVQGIHGIGLSNMVYSGFTKGELEGAGHSEILSGIDILVDGRYEHRLRNTGLRWRGSENQRVLFLSERYTHFELEERQEMEIVLEEDGSQRVYGYPESWVEDSFNDLLTVANTSLLL